VLDVKRLLNAVEDVAPVGAPQVMARELALSVAAEEVSFLAVDLGGRQLARLAHVRRAGADSYVETDLAAPDTRSFGRERSEEVPLPLGGYYETVLRAQQVQVEASGSRWLVVVPVSERGEAVGLLEMVLPQEPGERVLDYLRSAGHLMAFVLIANRRHTDLFEWGQRSVPLTLSAEIQRRLLPQSFTVESGPLTVAGWLEPAATIAGDTFDYSLNRDVLHLSVTDAMGHGVSSALLATLLVGSARNSRRQGLSLPETAHRANRAITEHAPSGDGFVTGLLLRIHLDSARVEVVNAGHEPPFLLRGERLQQLDLAADLPFGILPDEIYDVRELTLQPGDRLVIVTDGMLDRNAARLNLRAVLFEGRGLHPREAVRDLADAVVLASRGRIEDDATVLMLDWHGPDEHRHSNAGISIEQISPPHPQVGEG
jgi:serine phosphatase RsbU (regulator of sigma subunit)